MIYQLLDRARQQLLAHEASLRTYAKRRFTQVPATLYAEIAKARETIETACAEAEGGELALEYPSEVCRSCGRRNPCSFVVSDEAWAAVVGGDDSVRCLTCFDEEAQRRDVRYRPESFDARSWSDLQERAAAKRGGE